MLAELTTMLSVFDTTYQVSYSESYTGNVHGNSAIEGYPYFMSLFGVFESLMDQNYTSFVLAVGCIVAGIYCNKLWYFQNNLIFMVEMCVNSHPQGTSVLLEVPSIRIIFKVCIRPVIYLR